MIKSNLFPGTLIKNEKIGSRLLISGRSISKFLTFRSRLRTLREMACSRFSKASSPIDSFNCIIIPARTKVIKYNFCKTSAFVENDHHTWTNQVRCPWLFTLLGISQKTVITFRNPENSATSTTAVGNLVLKQFLRGNQNTRCITPAGKLVRRKENSILKVSRKKRKESIFTFEAPSSGGCISILTYGAAVA